MSKKVLSKADMASMKQSGMSYGAIAIKAKISRGRVAQLLAPSRFERLRMLSRAGHRCAACRKQFGALHLHHKTYGPTPEYEVLCWKCHLKKHDKFSGLTDKAGLFILLSPSEIEILLGLCLGERSRETSERLKLSKRTVEQYRKTMMLKLHAKSLPHAVYQASRAGLFSEEITK